MKFEQFKKETKAAPATPCVDTCSVPINVRDDIWTEKDPVSGAMVYMTLTEDGRKVRLEDTW